MRWRRRRWGKTTNPTIAILRFGPLPNNDITEGAILDVMESYGFISAEENRIFEARRDYEGEHITIYWGDAGFDFPDIEPNAGRRAG